MNVLPLIILLLLTLSALAIQQVQNFKNLKILHKEYADFIRYHEGEGINQRQLYLYNDKAYGHTARKLYFGAFMHKGQVSEEEFNQLRIITKELMKVLYGQADFYKALERKRPQFLDELLDQLCDAFEHLAEKGQGKHNRIENLARIKLADPELQEAFYYMLKGTVSRKELKLYQALGSEYVEKSYVSLLDYVKEDAAKNNGKQEILKGSIQLYLAPRELLLAIYGDSHTVDQILVKRRALKSTKESENAAHTEEFKAFMENLNRHPDISSLLLNYHVTTTNPEPYN